jgi:acyl-[acyl-carrier-protein]-phospholipid O-acyltransferase/long-chain-fatty-acid--[acyl-carrier-protein] ligase
MISSPNKVFYKTRRFFPLFVTQFLGAFNDNLFKNGLILLVLFHMPEQSFIAPAILVTLASGIFILPFFLFSATAGKLADKIDKARVARLVKIAEIVLMITAAAGFLLPSIPLLLVVLFGMGIHSAFFGPVKYAVLPQYLNEAELLAGNAWIEAGTFMAILLGTIGAGFLAMQTEAPVVIASAVIFVAIIGYAASRFLPAAPASASGIKITPFFWRDTYALMAQVKKDRFLFRVMISISWFWLVGATYLSQLPILVKDYLGGTESRVTLILAIFSVGIGCGSFLSNAMMKGRASLTPLPYAVSGMAIFGIDLFFAARGYDGGMGRIYFDLFALSACSGFFTVPLYTLLQSRADKSSLSRTIAGLNVLNALFMTVSALAVAALLHFSITVPQVLLGLAILNIPTAFYVFRLGKV